MCGRHRQVLGVHCKSVRDVYRGVGGLALSSRTAVSISGTCTMFAESEVISLRERSVTKEGIAAGLVESIAQRDSAVAKHMGLKKSVAFVGGEAKNAGIKAALERMLGVTLFVPSEPQITGALGGALHGKAEVLVGHEALLHSSAPLSKR